ncbi:hypothetical protein K438DRAFT_1970824 [Mycena galopus ATCC 62051]|nr:hypothetical protein K438DRAFT_1970824 [Mycena galopus ATCC 62051]
MRLGNERRHGQKDKRATKRKLDSDLKVDDDDDDGELPIDVTYYIYVTKPPGPVLTSKPYAALLSAIASELPCCVENIVKSEITWKPKLPKSADKLPLQNEIGYTALVMDIEAKTPEKRVVLLYMPPPMKPGDEPVV